MPAILVVLMFVSVALSAYAQAVRSGVWSWKRFGITVALLSFVGTGVGALASSLGRRAGPGHALAIALVAAFTIILVVFAFAFLVRGWTRPRRLR